MKEHPIVISKLAGGLGNQLFQYTVGRQLSLQKNVALVLDTSFYESQEVRSFKLQHFNIQAETTSSLKDSHFIKLCTGTNLSSKFYQTTQKFLPKRIRTFYKESKLWGYESTLYKTSPPIYLKGFWQHYKYYEQLHPQIITELTPRENPDEETKAIFNSLSKDEFSVSVHIRRGDYITNPEAKFMGVLPLDYYLKGIRIIQEKIKDPAFYFFSDDLQWVKDNLKIDARSNYMDIGQGKKDYLELYLMSKCRHNIIANSTFSWWSAFLNQHPNKIVVSPHQWVSDPEKNKGIQIQFPDWIKL